MSTNLRLFLKNTPENILAIPFSDTQACRKILDSLSTDSSISAYTIWLTQIEQIHRFVRQIPNLAWELMDYATEPLSIVYTHTKPLFPNTVAPKEICVRLITQESLCQVLSSKQVWFAVNIHALPSKSLYTDWVDKEIDMKGQIKPFRPVKVIRISANGEFSFLS